MKYPLLIVCLSVLPISKTCAMLCIKKLSRPTTMTITSSSPLRSYFYAIDAYYSVARIGNPQCYKAYEQKMDRCSNDSCCRNAFPNNSVDERTRDNVFEKVSLKQLIQEVEKNTKELYILDSCIKWQFLNSNRYSWSDYQEELGLIVFKCECTLNQLKMIYEKSNDGNYKYIFCNKEWNMWDAEGRILHHLIDQNKKAMSLSEEEVRKMFIEKMQAIEKE